MEAKDKAGDGRGRLRIANMPALASLRQSLSRSSVAQQQDQPAKPASAADLRERPPSEGRVGFRAAARNVARALGSSAPAAVDPVTRQAQLHDKLVGAAMLGDHKTLKLLLDDGLNPDFQDQKGDAPLHYCAEHGCPRLVLLLLENGAKIDICDNVGSTPLHRAAWNGHVEVAGMLIKNGADVNHQDMGGFSTLHWGVTSSSVKVCKLLLDHDADVGAGDKSSVTPMHLAAIYGNVPLLKLLLKRGGDVQAMTQYSNTPLHSAVENNHMDAALFLIKHGADVNCQDVSGFTPLHIAARRENVNLVVMLLDAGADPQLRTSAGKLAQDIARTDTVMNALVNAEDVKLDSGWIMVEKKKMKVVEATTEEKKEKILSNFAKGRQKGTVNILDGGELSVEAGLRGLDLDLPSDFSGSGSTAPAATQTSVQLADYDVTCPVVIKKRNDRNPIRKIASLLRSRREDREPSLPPVSPNRSASVRSSPVAEPARDERRIVSEIGPSRGPRSASSPETHYKPAVGPLIDLGPSQSSCIDLGIDSDLIETTPLNDDELVFERDLDSTVGLMESTDRVHRDSDSIEGMVVVPEAAGPNLTLETLHLGEAESDDEDYSLPGLQPSIQGILHELSIPSIGTAAHATGSDGEGSDDNLAGISFDEEDEMKVVAPRAVEPFDDGYTSLFPTAAPAAAAVLPSVDLHAHMSMDAALDMAHPPRHQTHSRSRSCSSDDGGSLMDARELMDEARRTAVSRSGVDPGLVALLAELGLERYTEAFIEEEWDFESLLQVTQEDLVEMGLKAGARRKLMTAISRVRGQQLGGSRVGNLSDSSESLSAPDLLRRSYGSSKPPWEIDYEALQLQGYLGKGFYGNVYKGLWGNVEVAVKKVTRQMDVEKWLLEVNLLFSLRHPNVVSFYCACVNPPNRCIVLEYVQRGSVQKVLLDPNVTLTHELRLSFARDTACGVQYLHSQDPPVIHRDLKSDNLLVTADWVVKVSDFGLSRFKDETYSYLQPSSPFDVTITSPEVLEQNHISEKADVYSFGLLLWELYTRRRPFKDMNPHWVAQSVINDQLRPSLNEAADWCPDYVSLMIRCWAQDHRERPTFQEILATLDQLYMRETAKPSAGYIGLEEHPM